MTASDKECTSQDDVVPGSAMTMTMTMTLAEIVRVATGLGGSEGTGHDDPTLD